MSTRQPVTVRGPIGSTEDLARSYGISARRTRQLIRMLEKGLKHQATIQRERKSKPAVANERNSAKARSWELKTRANGKVRAKSGKSSRRNSASAKTKKSH